MAKAEPPATKTRHHPLPALGQLSFSNFIHPRSLCTDFSRDLFRPQQKTHMAPALVQHSQPDSLSPLLTFILFFFLLSLQLLHKIHK